MGSSSTQGGHQVAQKFSSSGLPARDFSATTPPSGFSNSIAQSASSTTCSMAWGWNFHHARPAPPNAAAPATPAYSSRLRAADGCASLVAGMDSGRSEGLVMGQVFPGAGAERRSRTEEKQTE